MALQGLLDAGDEVLIPSPDYPLWTGAVGLCGGRAVHYRCDEQEGWAPDLGHVAEQISPADPGAGDHQPEQPDRGGVLQADPARPARPGQAAPAAGAHRRDLRPDPLRGRGARVRGRARPRPAGADPRRAVQDLPAGGIPVRAGWWSPARAARRPSTSRAWNCWPTCGCARTSRRSTRSGPRSAAATASRSLLRPGGRLREQRDHAWTAMNEIPGVDCVKPAGALYLFPRLDPDVHKIVDDERMVIDLLEQQYLLLVPRHRLQPAHRRPPAAGVPGPGRGARRRDRPAGPVPGRLPPVGGRARPGLSPRGPCGPCRPWPDPASWIRRRRRCSASRRPESAATPGPAPHR